MTVDPTAATAAEPGREGRGPAPGESLGKYRLERVLGAGGMGIVWAAFDPDLERAVAIKVLRAADSDEILRSRLLREARAMARLKHPNVLTVYEVGTVQNRDYIAMELVDGDNLDAWLSTGPPREQVVDALLAAGRGLAAAHAAGLVHRDFKPQNVLRSREGHVYVTDFGLARGQIEGGSEVEQFAVTALPDELATGSQYPRRALDSILDSPLTQTGVLIGTPAYMAPEQFAGRAPDARTDQFAFCVAAWEALTGVRPFRGATLGELEAAVGGGVRPVGGGGGGGAAELPPRAREVLVRGLDPSPAARWPDVPSLLGALANALAPEPRVVDSRARTRRLWLLVGAVAGVAAAATGLVFALDVGGARSRVASGGGDDCGSPEHAFDRAWSPDRQSKVVRAHPDGELIAAIAILSEVRRHWISELRASCAEKPSPARTQHLACLRGARDTVGRTTAALESPGGSLDIASVGTLAASLAMCEVGRPDRDPHRRDVHRAVRADRDDEADPDAADPDEADPEDEADGADENASEDKDEVPGPDWLRFVPAEIKDKLDDELDAEWRRHIPRGIPAIPSISPDGHAIPAEPAEPAAPAAPAAPPPPRQR